MRLSDIRRHLPAGQAGKKALVIVGHGSKLKGFQAAMERAASQLRKDAFFDQVLCAYLEITQPSIFEAVDRLVQEGVRKIFVLPYFLLKGAHTQVDIPEIVSLARRKHKGKVQILLCPYLGYDDRIVEVVKSRVQETQ